MPFGRGVAKRTKVLKLRLVLCIPLHTALKESFSCPMCEKGVIFMSKNLKKITATAMLLALEVILSRFLSYSVWNSKIGFGFVAVALCATFFGPVYALALGGLADFLGALLFPIGPYFFGFTFTAMLTGLSFGLFLYKKTNALKIFICVFINQFLLGLVINSFWIHLLYGTPFGAVIVSRIPQALILLAVQFATILALNKLVVKRLKRIL